jgi:nitrogen fixation/metabolism regulation signal transduction histidine kinase
MEKEIKSFGLAVAALPFALALVGLLAKLGVIEANSASSWSTLKFIVLIVCGLAYLIGTRIFKEHSGNVENHDSEPR